MHPQPSLENVYSKSELLNEAINFLNLSGGEKHWKRILKVNTTLFRVKKQRVSSNMWELAFPLTNGNIPKLQRFEFIKPVILNWDELQDVISTCWKLFAGGNSLGVFFNTLSTLTSLKAEFWPSNSGFEELPLS